MSLFDLVQPVLADYVRNRQSIASLLATIRERGGHGRIAFFPCSRYANDIVETIQQTDVDLAARLGGFFDESPQAVSHTGLPVRALHELDLVSAEISLVVVAVNTFIAPVVAKLRAGSTYRGEVLTTSYFDATLPADPVEQVMAEWRRVYELLADRKSRVVYLLSWLVRALNDEEVTYIFEGEEAPILGGEVTRYKGHTLKGLGLDCARELHAELYAMRHVRPRSGDTVLDIGAYKGDSAVFFAEAIGPQGRVYAFEPTSTSYAALRENIRLNRLETVVVPIHKGMGEVPGSMKATVIERGAPWSFLASDDGNEEVEITTIDAFVEVEGVPRVDFIKMDVEGLEAQVLCGGKQTIARHLPRLAIPLYHQTRDLLRLPLLVQTLAPYRLYLRSKMEGPFGITLFCGPTCDGAS